MHAENGGDREVSKIDVTKRPKPKVSEWIRHRKIVQLWNVAASST